MVTPRRFAARMALVCFFAIPVAVMLGFALMVAEDAGQRLKLGAVAGACVLFVWACWGERA